MAAIERITGPGFQAGLIVSELFKLRARVPALERESFLEDPTVFLRRFFEKHGHKVNRFRITVDAHTRLRRRVGRGKGGVDLQEIVVHVVQGGAGPGGKMYSVSDYICM